jgi:hypothetical protein
VAEKVDQDIGVGQHLHRFLRGKGSGNGVSISANTGPYRRNALSISSRIRTSCKARVTVSVSVRAPQIFLARWTRAGSMSQVFFTAAIRAILTFIRIV